MTEKPPLSSNVPAAKVVKSRRGVSPVWIVPIVAAFVGIWLAAQHYYSQGPLIEVHFETAEGVEAGKTSVQCRSVVIGKVESVRLDEKLKGVLLELRINREEKQLLRQDAQLWVVRPRFGGGSISGLGTLVSGSYIELNPGTSGLTGTRFKGLEQPPVTPKGVPGLRLTLISKTAGSLGPGSAIYFNGFQVGRIESRKFNLEGQRVEFAAFIDSAYGKLVTNHTRFWNVSGIDLDVSSSGVRLRTGTLESLVSGGISFSNPETGMPIRSAVNGAVYALYTTEDEPKDVAPNARLPYLLLFKNSVRGLSTDAPVEFRGIRVGTVTDISFDYMRDDPEHRVPVLIMLDPSLIANLPPEDMKGGADFMERSIQEGLRATLSTGSLLTGQLYVDLDFQQNALPPDVTIVEGFSIIPTVPSGLNSLQEKIAGVLDKIQALPLDDTVKNANRALAEISETATQAKGTVADFDRLLASNDTQNLPAEMRGSLESLRKTIESFNQNSAFYIQLDATLQQLNATLRSVDSLSNTIERKPSSLIWGNPKGKVAPPRAKR